MAESLTNPVLLPLILTAIVSVAPAVDKVETVLISAIGSVFSVGSISVSFLQLTTLNNSISRQEDESLILIFGLVVFPVRNNFSYISKHAFSAHSLLFALTGIERLIYKIIE